MPRTTKVLSGERTDRAATTGTGAGSTTETMIASHDLAIFERLRINIPQKSRRAILPLHPELLVEITIVNFAAPADADGVAAHQSANRCWIKRVNKQLYVFVESTVMPEITRKAADRQIRNRVEFIENNAEMRV